MPTNNLGACSDGESQGIRPRWWSPEKRRAVLRRGLRGLRVTLSLVTAAGQLGLLDDGVATTLSLLKAAATAAMWLAEWLSSQGVD